MCFSVNMRQGLVQEHRKCHRPQTVSLQFSLIGKWLQELEVVTARLRKAVTKWYMANQLMQQLWLHGDLQPMLLVPGDQAGQHRGQITRSRRSCQHAGYARRLSLALAVCCDLEHRNPTSSQQLIIMMMISINRMLNLLMRRKLPWRKLQWDRKRQR